MSRNSFPVIDWSYASARGSHSKNDDYGDGRLFDNYGVFALCDGLGGHEGGALAARFLVTFLLDRLPIEIPEDSELAAELLRTEINLAARQMRQRVLKTEPSAEPHTTCVLACISAEFVLSVHVGDSRFYMIRNDEIAWQSKDHSVARLVEDQMDSSMMVGPGDELKLYRTLTGDEDVEASTTVLTPIGPDDAIVLCTDGYWSTSDDSTLVALARTSNLDQAAETAVTVATKKNGETVSDDSSLMLIRQGALPCLG
jgi:serine/threonine protein phosphatase PrpC